MFTLTIKKKKAQGNILRLTVQFFGAVFDIALGVGKYSSLDLRYRIHRVKYNLKMLFSREFRKEQHRLRELRERPIEWPDATKSPVESSSDDSL